MMNTSAYNYEPVKSDNYYCLAALLETVFKTKGLQIDQKEIGNKLGIVLPSSDKNIDESKLGISIDEFKFNNFFKSSSLNYKATYIPANTIFDGELDEILDNYLKQNSHVIIAYNYDQLYGNIRSQIGHVSLVKEVKFGKVLLLDPGPKTFGEFSFDLDDVFEAMRFRNGGILILNSTT